jgi:hypothetical protein
MIQRLGAEQFKAWQLKLSLDAMANWCKRDGEAM